MQFVGDRDDAPPVVGVLSLTVPRVVTFGHARDNSDGFEVASLKHFDQAFNTLLSFVVTSE